MQPPVCQQGDSTRDETWRRALDGRKADALISDPPYCLLTRRRKDGELRDAKHKKIDRGPVRRFENVREFRDFSGMTPGQYIACRGEWPSHVPLPAQGMDVRNLQDGVAAPA